MRRQDFLKILSADSLTGMVKKENKNTDGSDHNKGPLMPLLFVGHGSPMNALEDNEFVRTWQELAKSIPRPKAILCISAHWETRGLFLTGMKHPETIHDFGGFPRELYEINYPAPGDPDLAKELQKMITVSGAGLDEKWGLDHGSWSILRRMYPAADIPVIQLSLDYTKSTDFHYKLGQQLRPLREQGVLILGSGNLIHNLGLLDWKNIDKPGYGYDWAVEATGKIKELVLEGDHKSLIGFRSLGKSFDLAVPTPEHFLPLLYILALQQAGEKVSFFNDRHVAGSLSMTSLKIE
jgi:4,5-DOPA dioxygenase extradiol